MFRPLIYQKYSVLHCCLASSIDAAYFSNANKLGLADEVVPTEAESVKKESEPEQNQEQSEPETKEDAKKQDPEKSKEKLNKRFDKVSKRAQEAEAKAAQLERELNELRAKATPQEPQEQKPVANEEKPQASQFNDAYEYAEALAEWSAEQALLRRDAEEAQRKAQEAEAKKAKDTGTDKGAAALRAKEAKVSSKISEARDAIDVANREAQQNFADAMAKFSGTRRTVIPAETAPTSFFEPEAPARTPFSYTQKDFDTLKRVMKNEEEALAKKEERKPNEITDEMVADRLSRIKRKEHQVILRIKDRSELAELAEESRKAELQEKLEARKERSKSLANLFQKEKRTVVNDL